MLFTFTYILMCFLQQRGRVVDVTFPFFGWSWNEGLYEATWLELVWLGLLNLPTHSEFSNLSSFHHSMPRGTPKTREKGRLCDPMKSGLFQIKATEEKIPTCQMYSLLSDAACTMSIALSVVHVPIGNCGSRWKTLPPLFWEIKKSQIKTKNDSKHLWI